MNPLLTVGIPTYNRRRFITALVSELAGVPVETLVIDDASTDGTADALSAVDGIRLLSNEANLGYAKNLLRVFEETTTPFILVTSDDDIVVAENLLPLQDFLRQHDPAFVCTQFFRDGKLWRGRAEVGFLRPEDFRRASGHTPGLVFRSDAVRPLVPALRARLDQRCVATAIYPQVLIVAYLLAEGRSCMWWDRPATEYGALEPSGIRDGTDSYTTLESRWRQEQAFIDFFREQARSAPVEDRERWLLMSEVEEQMLFPMLRAAVGFERPDLLACFDSAAAAFHARASDETPLPRRFRHAWRATKRIVRRRVGRSQR